MARTQGTIVKAAPTFTPQVINSRLRLLSMLDTSLTRERVWTSHGYIVGLAPRPESSLLRTHTGPRVMFYSAGLESNVVGARYRLPAPETLDFYVDPADGHDDFLISLALLAEAAQSLTLPAASTVIRPLQLYGEEGRY